MPLQVLFDWPEKTASMLHWRRLHWKRCYRRWARIDIEPLAWSSAATGNWCRGLTQRICRESRCCAKNFIPFIYARLIFLFLGEALDIKCWTRLWWPLCVLSATDVCNRHIIDGTAMLTFFRQLWDECRFTRKRK